MSSFEERKAVADKVVGLCAAYLAKSVGDELAYLVLVSDTSGEIGTVLDTDMSPDSAVSALRELADNLEQQGPDSLRQVKH